VAFKQEDWLKAQRRLSKARELYQAYKQQPDKSREPDLLDDAVLKAWTLESMRSTPVLRIEDRPVQNHSQPIQARILFQAKHLSQDYFDPLEKLDRFRKKASHLGYMKEASTPGEQTALNA